MSLRVIIYINEIPLISSLLSIEKKLKVIIRAHIKTTGEL